MRSLNRRDCLTLFMGSVVSSVASCASAGLESGTMENELIEELARLSGQDYATARNSFLASAAPLPAYSASLSEHDPRYRAQYLILREWQRNPKIPSEIDAELNRFDAGQMSRSAAGFSPVKDLILARMQDWKDDALPFFWEDILKFDRVKPDWQIETALTALWSRPNEGSIDPLLISMHTKTNESEYLARYNVLRQMPERPLRDRLEEDGAFYTSVRPIIEKVLTELR